MAEEKVGIEVEIDVDKAKQRLKEIKDQIAELKEQWGTAGKETLDKVLQPLLDEQESLEEQLKNVKEATDNVSKSFKKQASELNDVKDVTEFAGDATKALGVDETALGEAVANTTGFIGKSITFIKKGAAAMDALKGATNGATGAVNKFKAALNGLLKHPILILLAGIAATMAIVYKRFKDFSDGMFDKRIGVIERSTELFNEKLQNQITILGALGAKQSTVTKQQINNINELNKRLEKTKEYYQEMWDDIGGNNDLGYMANEYLKGNKKLIDELNEQEQELVKKYAEANELIRKNKNELEILQNVTLKINIAEEKYELVQERINNKLTKQLNILNRRKQLVDFNIKRLSIEQEYNEKIFDEEKKSFDLEQEKILTQIENNNELIDSLKERKDAYTSLKGEIMNSGKSVADIERELTSVDHKLIEINRDIETIQESNNNLNSEYDLNIYNRKLDYTQQRLESISKLNKLNLEYEERQLKLENSRAFMPNTDKLEELFKAEGGVGKTYPLIDYFNKLNEIYKATGDILDDYIIRAEESASVAEDKAEGFIHRLTNAIKRVREELKNVDSPEENEELINSLSSRLKILTDAYEEYMQISSNLLNTLEGVQLEVFSVTKDRIGGVIDVFNSIVPINDMTTANEVIGNYVNQLHQLKDAYFDVYNALYIYRNQEIENSKEYLEQIKDWPEWQRNLFNQFKDLNGAGVTVVYEMYKELYNSAVEYELESKKIIMTNKQMKASFMEDYASLGQIINGDGSIQQLTLKNLYNAQTAAIDAEKDYMDELLKANGQYYNSLIQAGLNEAQAESVLAEKRLQVESELVNKKTLLNQQYMQTVLNATSDTMNDINSIMDVAFEDNKQVRGATLMMTTLADAAAAYTSVFAQAPGGVAAKTAQAVIASAAVMARGIASYNSLMNMTKDSGSESLSSATATNTIPTATGVDTTSVARTLIGSRYAGEGHTTQYVLVTDEVTARQKQAQGARRLETI